MAARPKLHGTSQRSYKRHENLDGINNRHTNRALSTSSREWRQLRATQLEAKPFCRMCLERGRRKIANEVDHIDGDAYNNDPDNFQSLCRPCHSRKTIGDINRRRVESYRHLL